MSQFDRLVEIMSRLRAPNGCPWDLKQDHESLKSYLIEEAYEVLDAIDSGDDRELCEELGDVLLQIVFHAQIAREEDRFTMEEVAASISDKLERRHPHVFGDTSVENADEVLRNWEAIKSREHEEKGREPSVLEGLSRHLPALLRARRAQERAAKVGFRWDRSDDVVEKAREEVEEFLVAREDGNAERLEEELGDLLFSLVNVASYLRICPEEALRKTIGKFEARFRFIESELAKAGKTPQAATIEEMDRLWECSKSA